MGNERMKSLHQINSLNPKKDKEFTLIKSQLQQIYYVLKTPTLDRVFRLSGLNPPINSLLLKSNTGKIRGFLENVFHLMRLDPFFKSQTKKYNEFLSIASPFLLGEKVLGPAIRRITTDEHLPQSPTLIVGGANELENAESHSLSGVPHNVQAGAVKDSTFNAKDPISYAQHEIHLASFPVDKRSSNTPTSISHQKYLPETVPTMSPSQEGSLLLPNGKGIPSGNSQIQSSRTGMLHGDVFGIVKDKIIEEPITIWKFLQDKLISLSKKDSLIKQKNCTFQLAFLKSFFQLGDYIFRYGLLPSTFIDSIEIFKPKILQEMVKFHIDILFLKYGRRFFVAQDSVVPQIEFLTNGLAVEHFHRSIRALSAEDEKNLVYQVLSTIWYHMIKCFPGSQLTLGFTTNAETFRHAEFLKQADSLSSALLDAPEIEHMNIIDYTPIAQLVRSLVNNFRTPDRRAVQIRIQFQMIFYILEFLDQYYKPIVRKVLVWPNNYSDLQKELKFMGSYLKFFRNRDQYPSKQQLVRDQRRGPKNKV
ncbi:uncharacterized protein PGTG_07042 [Puccinia graminis f. sp. tritici CRL 75-36-700-3]|uniref:Uncharacterized protein n=1 Tax=Puccinia graminis f. sp. tritici (strain CRL 75-36-700-3 / race SCCL) TaxID=418459 RepID=E3KAK9_PUCGT|nr:uncharacterized protein PGTG_07042 [Puccinia graminis f. sp. tritici CRL 75-36-700-3]EFP81421.2 hypothetical protein PGTG_07042 [Puccinia graminis f. sp. tritici CRL 75-36-700-3]